MPRPKHVMEYAALRAAAAGLNVLPHAAALAIAWLLARFAFHVVRFRRREAVRRIRLVLGPGLPAPAAQRVAWIALRNLFFNAAEMMRARRFRRDWMRAHVEGLDATVGSVRDLIAEHGGVVIALPHMGNWDMAGIACHLEGLRVFSVAARQRNPLVNDWMNHQRGCGIDMLERGSSTLRQVVRRLRDGGAFAILPDSRTPRPDLAIPFLGGVANLGRGMAQFARAAHVPILPAVVTRVGWRRHRFTRLPAVFPDKALDKEADIHRMTARVIAGFDAAIRAEPGQWFWYNKRWVLDPLEPAVVAAAADETSQEQETNHDSGQ